MTADTLLHWLQRTSIEASVLILAVLALRLMLGTRLSPSWRIGLWMLVGIKLMLPAFIPAGFGLGTLGMETNDRVDRNGSILSAPAVLSTPPALPRAAPRPPLPQSSFSTRHFVLATWLLGAFGVLAAALLRQRRFHRHLARLPFTDDPHLAALVEHHASLTGVSPPRAALAAPGSTPALVGIRQPKILLPSDWQSRFTDRSLRHVLLHELLHIRHRDLIWNWAATAVQALHWFNPLVWFVVSRFQADRELRCDAGALALLSPTERLDYGRTLLRIQETFFAPPAIAGLAPCVRNHPTLRQRILMITHPATRQPWLHPLLVLTLGVLAGYSFTTARAAEKEVPPKVREGSTPRSQPSDKSDSSDKKPALKDGEREGGKPGAEREGGVKKPSAERDGGTKKPGMRDGEGGAKKPGTGDGEGTRKPGPRDGEGMKKSGMRDGDHPRTGERDGEGRKPSAESGQKPRKDDGDRETASSGEVITMHVPASGDTIVINGQKHPLSGLRGYLKDFLPEHPGAKVLVSGDPDTPLKSLHQIIDAVRDNGNKNVSINSETPSPAQDTSDVAGEWFNLDKNTRDITRMQISPVQGGYSIHLWGSAGGGETDMGAVFAQPAADTPGTLTATKDYKFMQLHLTLGVRGTTLKVTSHHDYEDPKRQDIHIEHSFKQR